MKKLSLKNLNFNSIEKLQREELKTLLGGGYDGGGSGSKCKTQCQKCEKNSDCCQGVCGNNSVQCEGIPKYHCVY